MIGHFRNDRNDRSDRSDRGDRVDRNDQGRSHQRNYNNRGPPQERPTSRDDRDKPRRQVNPDEIENRMPKFKPDAKPVSTPCAKQ